MKTPRHIPESVARWWFRAHRNPLTRTKRTGIDFVSSRGESIEVKCASILRDSQFEEMFALAKQGKPVGLFISDRYGRFLRFKLSIAGQVECEKCRIARREYRVGVTVRRINHE